MRLLVLGGTRFVGRAVVEEALARGWEVDAVHRGVTGALPDGARALHADRTDPAGPGGRARRRHLGRRRRHLGRGAARGAGGRAGARRAGRPCGLRQQPLGLRPDAGAAAPRTRRSSTATPAPTQRDYPADKRGGELAWLEAFPDALLLRAGLVLGPHEDVARLPWWLDRISRGGRVVAPGRPERGLQYVDARDLAAFALDGLESGLSGPYDVDQRARPLHDAGPARGLRRGDRQRRRAGLGRRGRPRRGGGAAVDPAAVLGARDGRGRGRLRRRHAAARWTPGWTAVRSSRPSPTPGPGCRRRASRRAGRAASRACPVELERALLQ